MSQELFKTLKPKHLLMYKGLVKDMQNVVVDKHGNIRIYYVPSEYGEGSGFEFVICEFMRCKGSSTQPWEDEDSELEVEVLMHGQALYDGIRHICVGEGDNFGYVYYPGSKDWISIWENLHKLELKYCQEDMIN